MHTGVMAFHRSRTLVAVVVALLATVAAGCAGSSGVAPELTSLTQVAERSASVDSARFALTFDLTLPGADGPVSFSADGAFDTPGKRAQLNLDLSSVTELVKAFGAQLGGTPSGDLGSPDDWKLEIIQDGDTAYARFPLLAKELPAGKTWIKIDAKELSNVEAGQLGQLGSLTKTAPSDVFELLKAVSGPIEAVGSEDVRGVETSHYRTTLDAAKITELVPDAQRQSLGGLDETLQSALSELPLEIWIDADQRIRKLSIELAAKQPLLGEANARLTVEVFDYGQPLELELPPADQIVDATTLKPK